MSLKQIFLQIKSILDYKDKLFASVLFFLFFLSAFIELITISSLIPFLNIMLEPNMNYENFKYKYLIFSEKLFSYNPFAYITAIFVALITISTILKFIILKWNFKITKIFALKMSSIVFNNIIEQTYISFSRKNSSEYISILEGKVDLAVDYFFRILQITSAIIIVVAITTTLLIIDFWITIIFSTSFTLLYLTIIKFTKKKLFIIDKEVAHNLDQRVKIVQETMSIFRQIRLDNLSKYFKKSFWEKNVAIRSGNEKLGVFGNSPRIIIEGTAIILVAIISYLLIVKNIYDEKYILTLVGAIVFGSSRILPLIQLIYYNVTFMIGQKKSVLDVFNIFILDSKTKTNEQEKLKFEDQIKFENVCFSYTNDKNVLENLNFTIKKNSIIGLIGKTGSGKSTIVDLLSGLLAPSKGKITVDNNSLENALLDWQKKISYIDQKITLIDTSIAENIALGKDLNQIDYELLQKVMDQSECTEFVDNLKNKYFTEVGERGVRLSGGQVQRIGIARALYKKSDILILDEPTSAVDQNTESLIMQSIEKLRNEKTIIIITHRSSTLKNCDEIYEVKNKNLTKI